jgi:uncharacterized protein (TIGR03435 family)
LALSFRYAPRIREQAFGWLHRGIESIMSYRGVQKLNFAKKISLFGAVALGSPVLVGTLNVLVMRAQDVADWQTAAGGKMAFDAASVKPSTGLLFPDFPLNSNNAKPPGNSLSAAFPLETFISFAYKLNAAELRTAEAHWPAWVRSDRFTIMARAEGNPSKDQMRLMMQSLLSDRFRLAVHFETEEVPNYAMTFVKAGTTGPKLRPHSAGPPCPEDIPPGPGFKPPPKAGEIFAVRYFPELVQARRHGTARVPEQYEGIARRCDLFLWVLVRRTGQAGH